MARVICKCQSYFCPVIWFLLQTALYARILYFKNPVYSTPFEKLKAQQWPVKSHKNTFKMFFSLCKIGMNMLLPRLEALVKWKLCRHWTFRSVIVLTLELPQIYKMLTSIVFITSTLIGTLFGVLAKGSHALHLNDADNCFHMQPVQMEFFSW